MKYYIPDLLDAFPPDAKEVSAPDMDKLREDVAKRLAAERPAQKRPRRFGKTLLIAAAAAALLSVTALAAAFGGFDWLRDEVEPEFIDAVEPVEQSVTDEGIRFSVIAAQKFRGHRARVLLYDRRRRAGTRERRKLAHAVGAFYKQRRQPGLLRRRQADGCI